jgi:hypothetical protein
LPRAIRGPREDADRRERAEQTAKRISVAARLHRNTHGICGTPSEDIGDAESCSNLNHARAVTSGDHCAHRDNRRGLCSAHAALA